MEIHNVLADEVELLDAVIGQEFVKRPLLAVGLGLARIEIGFQRRQVSNGRIEPHIKILAGCIGNLDAEVRRITRNVPIVEILAVVSQPLGKFIDHLALEGGLRRPFLQKLHATFIGEFEEKMFRLLQDRLGAGKRRERVLQVSRRIHRAAVFAAIAVLVRSAALRAFALDVAIRQKHALDGVKELFDFLRGNQLVGLERLVNRLREFGVLA